jgi:exopolyphosphatase / guanosine-5'-triphosphate,3'-diphosphate pyrophosphatase
MGAAAERRARGRGRGALGERLGADHTLKPGEVLGAIDVGTNAVRLKLVRLLDDGSFDQLHQERDPVRPGEGVWETGAMARPVVERLVRVMAKYGDICRRARTGHLRAVATSALREAKNREAVIARVREVAGVELEVVSGKEEARLICLGVLRGMPGTSRSLLFDIGGGSTEVARGAGEEPNELWSVPLGAVRLTEMFGADGAITREQLTALRRFAQRAVAETLPGAIVGAPRHALGSSGTIRTVCAFAAKPGTAHATRDGLTRAVEELVALGPEGRRKRFDAQRAGILVSGAVILESLAHHLRVESVTAVDGGLKEGLLVDLVRRSRQRSADPLLSEAVLAAGRRFSFDEPHALHTRDVALSMFDQLARIHGLPPDARLLLEVAATLHDVGNVVSRSRHHKHSHYLIGNMDLPGLSDHERDLAALVARFHRRSAPRKAHPLLTALPPVEVRLVRKLAVLLRIADALDRGRQQPLSSIEVVARPRAVRLRLHRLRGKTVEARAVRADLEADVPLFRSVFGRSLIVETVSS